MSILTYAFVQSARCSARCSPGSPRPRSAPTSCSAGWR